MDKKRVIHEIIILFWLFVIGSVVGYIYEMIVVLFKKGYFESRQGLIYGPFTPVYGIGAIVYYLTLNLIEKRSKKESTETALRKRSSAKLSYYFGIFCLTAILRTE